MKSIWSENRLGVALLLVVWCSLFIYCLGEAVYQDHHYFVDVIKSKNALIKTKDQNLEALTVPKVNCRIDQVALAPTGKNAYKTITTINATVHNLGAPSVLDRWYATLTFVGGNTGGYELAPPLPGKYITLYFGNGNTNHLELAESDHLSTQTRSHPIEHGGGMSGWIQYVFPISLSQLGGGGLLSLSTHDVVGNSISCEYKITSERHEPLDLQDLLKNNKRSRE
jgi:hypothetical protein